MSLVVDYLALQKFRFGDKLEYQIRGMEEAKPSAFTVDYPTVGGKRGGARFEKKEGKGRVWVDVSRPGTTCRSWCAMMEWGNECRRNRGGPKAAGEEAASRENISA